MASALLVIDVQQSFEHLPFWSEDDLPAYQAAQTALIQGCRARRVPVVQVFHHNLASDSLFNPANGRCVAQDWLPKEHDHRVVKHVHNALTDSGLDVWLRRQGVDHLIISGMRTEQCCETTARVASDLGYRVDFVSEATLTFAMRHPDGREFSAAEIRARTELVLDGRFARVCTVAECLESLEH
ncbi:isochorismatase family protein [Chitinilyticum aquatile]|uniref:isochorismatase family protein n=1 Tax=Chitinilyticum aquatile TaxID=362520 RepID=UPI000424A7A7|nr:isochorismatase family protein [Chitinilyticum aquatile]